MKNSILSSFLAVLLTPVSIPVVFAQDTEIREIEEIVTIGTRRQEGRSATDSLVPVDVLSGDDFLNQGSTNLDSHLATLIPSYNVFQESISDAATLIRPARMRGLPPDNTLVLVNGKRRHRASIITFLGGGVADGAHGPDLSVIPAIALKQVEVLRDGAAAQYGSDAIAGVIDFRLKDAAEGGTLEARWGQYYEGDGDAFNIAGNIGLPLSAAGFANLSFEYKESDSTSRSEQWYEAQDLTAAGNPHIEDPDYPYVFHPAVAEWGAPKFEYDYKFFGNAGMELSDGHEAYAFGNYAKRKVEGGFFYRNPHTRLGVFSDTGFGYLTDDDGRRVDIIKVADLSADGMSGNCPQVLAIDNVPDRAALDAVAANPDCFSFIDRFPGGFTPRFGGVLTDYSAAIGLRGDLGGWFYDASAVVGRNNVDFFMRYTINPQLLVRIPAEQRDENLPIPTDYSPGAYTETDYTLNLDLSRSIDVAGLYSPLYLALGAEYREEKFEAESGGENSWFIDTRSVAADGVRGLAEQGFGVGSNGFPGFGPRTAGKWTRDSYAFYTELETELSEDVTVAVAGRYEDYGSIGDSLDGKFTARWQLNDNLALRGAISTGFRAPTAGQANVVNVSTVFADGRLTDEATLPPTHPAAQLIGAEPLTPEESTNYTIGTVISADKLDITVDYFRAEVRDRIARSTRVALTPEQTEALLAQGIEDARTLTSLQFYTNDFDTTTQGVDIVATLPLQTFGGDTMLSFAGNWTDTKVDSFDPSFIDAQRVEQLEEGLPDIRFSLTANHVQGPWRFLLRGRYYDSFVDFALNEESLRLEGGARWLMDTELAYTFKDRLTFVVGAENFIDTTPTHQKNNPGLFICPPSPQECRHILGQIYPESSPYGFNGGFYYLRTILEF